MHYLISNPEVTNAFIFSTPNGKPGYGFNLQYKMTTAPNRTQSIVNKMHRDVSPELYFHETYHLVPGAHDHFYSVIGLEETSLNAYRVKMVEQLRDNKPFNYRSQISFGGPNRVQTGLLEHDFTNAEGTFDPTIFKTIREQLIQSFGHMKGTTLRVLDAGVMVRLEEAGLFGPLAHHRIGERIVASFNHVHNTLKFTLADSLLDEYQLVEDENGFYVDLSKDNGEEPIVSPNMFTWL